MANKILTLDNIAELKQLVDEAGSNIDIVQETGTSTTSVMSQNAVTKELDKKQNTLETGTTIKTLNKTALLGSGNIVVPQVLFSGRTGLGSSLSLDFSNGDSVEQEIPVTWALNIVGSRWVYSSTDLYQVILSPRFQFPNQATRQLSLKYSLRGQASSSEMLYVPYANGGSTSKFDYIRLNNVSPGIASGSMTVGNVTVKLTVKLTGISGFDVGTKLIELEVVVIALVAVSLT